MQRDISLDSFRGLLVVYITAGHLMMTTFTAFPKARELLLYPMGYFQVITAFVFVSGLIVGKVSSVVLAKKGMNVILRGVRDRVMQIYFAHLLVVLWVAVSVQLIPSLVVYSRLVPFQEDFWGGLVKGALLLVQPDFVDILPVYLFASLMVPPLLWLMQRGLTVVALLISVALWLYGQTEPQLMLQQSLAEKFYLDLGRFEFFAWQLIYVIAVVVGYHAREGNFTRLLNRFYLSQILLIVSVSFVVFILLNRWDVITIKRFPPREWVNLRLITWFCLLNFLAVAYLLYRMIKYWPRLFQWRWLAFLGRHGIWVFSYHCLVVFALLAVRPNIIVLTSSLQICLLVCCLASLFVPAYLHAQYQQWKKQKSSRAMSVVEAG